VYLDNNSLVIGIHVSSEEVLRLRAVAEEAAKKKQSVIFLPNHKSHVDYVSLQIICYRLGISLPIVVAGDNLNIPALGQFLQHAGTSIESAIKSYAEWCRCNVD
jgi:glycerol-3-phosphate O-acyltransferase